MTPRVVDTSHHNTVNDLSATAAAGVWGVIHKASQGSHYRDPDYAKRRTMAVKAGLLWGAYHFNDGSDVNAQVDNFLDAAAPDDDTLLVLDYEDVTDARGNRLPESRQMSPQEMVEFLRLIEQRTGRKATIYSGNRLKENIGRLSSGDKAYVCQHKLWLCQYGPTAKLPEGFTSYFLWQFTDGHVGPQPHVIAGISGNGIDLNHFDGTHDELLSLWTSNVPTAEANVTASSHAADAAADDYDPPVPSPQAPSLNVQPTRVGYSFAVEMVQQKLKNIGYHEVGEVDGFWGGKTAGAIKAFYNDRGVTEPVAITAEQVNSTTLSDEIGRAIQEKWTRPISINRASATPQDIAPRVEAVRVSLWQKFGAQIAAGVSAVGITGSTLSSAFTNVQTSLQPVHDAFAKIPPEVWFMICGAVAGLVWYGSTRAARAATKDYNTGRLN
jgi:lysozyme